MRTLREDGAQKVLAGMTAAAEVLMITTGDAS
jgi:type II secretory ATPase GspE/PulE/Tfp pilus assembly ATPase PilB-like protein